MASSTPRRFIFSFMCLRTASAEISSPFTALYAVRRKFTTLTPGTSVGYWNPGTSRRWARWSGGSLSTSSPRNRTSPLASGRRPVVHVELDLGPVGDGLRADDLARPAALLAHVDHRDLAAVPLEAAHLALRDARGPRDGHERHADSLCSSCSMACDRPS